MFYFLSSFFMKKIVLTALSASILMTAVSPLFAESNYYEPSKESIVAKQQSSSAMRMQYYDKYIAKGYDVSSIKPYLDGATSTEWEFWEALKKMQNTNEVPDRRSYVAKLQKNGYDVSGFTETVIWDSWKFWEMVKSIENAKKYVQEVKKEEYKAVEMKKEESVKTEYKKVEEKKSEGITKLQWSSSDRLKSAMKARIAKIPAESRDVVLIRLHDILVKNIANAQAKNAKLLAARYEIMLAVVREEMETVDDETLINSLFQ